MRSEKEAAWEQALADVDALKDAKDMGVDESIKESVAAFLIHEFATSGSCEGHVAAEGEKQHGLSYPWIDVLVRLPRGWKDASKETQSQIERETKTENLEQQRKLLIFLEEFYQGRETAFDARLIMVGDVRFGFFRVQSLGAGITALLPLEERRQKLALFRKEMQDFTAFLKNKYFQSGENPA